MWVMSDDKNCFVNINAENSLLYVQQPTAQYLGGGKPKYHVNCGSKSLGTYSSLTKAQHSLSLLAKALEGKETEVFYVPMDEEIEKLTETSAASTRITAKGTEEVSMSLPKSPQKQKTIYDLVPGDRFWFKKYEWIVLDMNPKEGGILAIMATPLYKERYGYGSNDYKKSKIRKKLIETIQPYLEEKNLIPHEIDLIADNGEDDYGKITDKVFILNCDEYRKYSKYIPLQEDSIWTCTPSYIANSKYYIRCMTSLRHMASSSVNTNKYVFPACIFNTEAIKDLAVFH